MRLYSRLLSVQYAQPDRALDLASHLEARQLKPAHVFLTHLHADHTAGLLSIPAQSHVYFGKRERGLLSRLLCSNHLAGRSFVHLLDMLEGKALAPFSHVIDVFGDATLWAISTPGHTPDHLAYLINTTPNPVLVVGDAELTTWAMQEGILVSTTQGSRGRREVRRSASMIRAFHAEYPDAQIWFSHDEEHL